MRIERIGVVLVAVLGFASSNGCSKPAEQTAKYMKNGQDYMEKKDYSRAALEFLNAAKNAPKDAEPQYQLALACIQLQDWRKAAQALQKAIDLNPRHTGAQLKLAELMATTSDKAVLEDAKQRLDTIVINSPDDVAAVTALSITEARLGNPDEAIQNLEEALQKAPADLRASVTLARLKLAQNDIAGAGEVLDVAVKQAPQSVAAALARAQFYVAAHKLDQAEAEARRAIQLDPKNGTALLTAAYVQINQKQMDQAEQTYRHVSALPEKQYKPLHAIFLVRTGQADAGIAELQQLLKANPKDRDLRTQLVAAYLAANKQADAEKLLTDAIKARANDSLALFQRGAIYLRAGKYDEAEKDLTQLAGAQRGSAPVHYALAKVRAARGDTLGQRHELEEALRLNPNELNARVDLVQVLLAGNQANTALDLVNHTPDAQKSNVTTIAARAAVYLVMGDQAEARRNIDQGLTVAKTPALLLEDATLKTMQKDYAGARVALEEAIKVQPLNMRVWNLLVQTYAAEKQMPKAVQRLREAAAQNPKSANLQFLLAQTLVATGDRKDARTAFAAAREADPGMAGASFAQAQLEMEDGKFEAARQILNEFLAKNPKSSDTKLRLAALEEKAGNHSASIAQYRSVLDADPNNIAALNNLAWAYLKDDPDDGLNWARQAEKLAPDNSSIQDTLGWLYYRKGLYDSAVRHLKTAVDKEGTPARKYHLGMALTKTGDQVGGQKMIRSALDADPTLAKTQGN